MDRRTFMAAAGAALVPAATAAGRGGVRDDRPADRPGVREYDRFDAAVRLPGGEYVAVGLPTITATEVVSDRGRIARVQSPVVLCPSREACDAFCSGLFRSWDGAPAVAAAREYALRCGGVVLFDADFRIPLASLTPVVPTPDGSAFVVCARGEWVWTKPPGRVTKVRVSVP